MTPFPLVDDDDDMPQTWSTKSHFRMTRRGKLFKTVREQYLRDDLGLGFVMSAPEIDKETGRVNNSQAPSGAIPIDSTEALIKVLIHRDEQGCKTQLVVCDTNVLIHNLDVLEHPSFALANIVIPQTALQECRKNSLSHYNRAMEFLKSNGGDASAKHRCVIFFADVHHMETQISLSKEKRLLAQHLTQLTQTEARSISDNDMNDLRLRKVAAYFGSHLSGNNLLQVVFLTDDRQCRELAQLEQVNIKLYQAQSVRDHVKQLQQADQSLSLMDVVAQHTSSGSASADKTVFFDAHLPMSEISVGVKTNALFQGVIRCADRHRHEQCYVNIRQGDESVAVQILGSKDVNRAVDGDIVAIQLHPVEQWINPLGQAVEQKSDAKNVDVMPMETAEASIRDSDNVTDEVEVNQGLVKPTAKVVGIVRRNFRQNYCGSIYTSQPNELVSDDKREIAAACEMEHPDGTFTCVFFAVDKRVPPVLIRTSQLDRLLGKRLLVAIDSWPADSPYPLGHYVHSLGDAGNKDVETEVVLHEHNIPCEPFSAKVLACLPPEDYKIDLQSSPDRLDMRHLPVLSIDPPGCKDIDDALHCIVLENGNYQVGVHIADVTHYVKPGTAIDLEAANRSTSTYLVNKRLDMLPGLLTTDLCSLKGNVDRFAFSVLWEVTPDADILDVEFKKTIIHSIGALTYQEAQTLIDAPENSTENQIKEGAVKRLNSLAKKFRAKRLAAGALTLASPEVKFVLDTESLNPTDVQAYSLLEANMLVEEFMLLANVTVGKKILRNYPTLSVLRRHPVPSRAMFETLIKKAKSKGFDIKIDDSKLLADSLDAAVIPSDPYFNKLLRILSTRCMFPAQYFCSGEYKPSEWHHYGLAAPVYTHFTSPIRRYADVCVHRLLAAAIGVAPLPPRLSSRSVLHDLAANMNRRHRAAQMAGRASVQLHTLLFFSEEGGTKQEDAYVLDVDTNELSEPSFTVFVPRYGIEGRVKVHGIDPQDCNLVRDPDKFSLLYKNPEGNVAIKVFDKVRVSIWVRSLPDFQKELVVDLIEPEMGHISKQIPKESGKKHGAPPLNGDVKRNKGANRKKSKSRR